MRCDWSRGRGGECGAAARLGPRPPFPTPARPRRRRGRVEHALADSVSRPLFSPLSYILLAFPCLAAAPPGGLHVLELGCGAGSALLPVLRASPGSRVTGTDVAPLAVAHFMAAATRAGFPPARTAGLVLDATAPAAPAALARAHADAVLLIFTLGALDGARVDAALATAAAALAPGGTVCVRDHGLYDITHMRAPRQARRGWWAAGRETGWAAWAACIAHASRTRPSDIGAPAHPVGRHAHALFHAGNAGGTRRDRRAGPARLPLGHRADHQPGHWESSEAGVRARRIREGGRVRRAGPGLGRAPVQKTRRLPAAVAAGRRLQPPRAWPAAAWVSLPPRWRPVLPVLRP